MDNGRIMPHLQGPRRIKVNCIGNSAVREFLKGLTYEKVMVPSRYKGRSRQRLLRCAWVVKYKGEAISGPLDTLRDVRALIKEKLDV